MRTSQRRYALRRRVLFSLPSVLMILFIAGCSKLPDLPSAKVTTVASGLMAPMGIETDWHGNIWVAETGTAHNDGKVVVIVPGSDKNATATYDAIINLSSITNALSGEVEGPAHMLFDNGILYILAGDFLYTADVSSFRPGDPAIDATTLSHEDIGSYVRSLNIVTPNDSHPYNLTKGPGGDIYIADAGANAIIQRKKAGDYSVFAQFPDFPNPTSVGPPYIQRVPTGIIFNGNGFLVSTLTGFPFLKGEAVIYRVSMAGKISVYKKNLTTLTDIAPGNFFGEAVLHFANFGATDFEPNTGSLLLTNGLTTKTIADGLNMPAGLKQTNHKSWYVTSLADGTLLEISYTGGGN
ncbi:ScyD/ScyE family protein [Parafilimonas terrae]|jgi:hypothetical protein|uniref:ScyD/ScyE family protein n=1 Tax=Parafilimonas terrae TaxID=1465490 RepID=A0A1I5U1G7_9BACT|nr:ScyD/ScyE family protein [Parafilimonas terrae]SFP89138.1 hypothetical protein SAMN05444277_1037 [Parafilimonas terrae]